MKSVKWSGVDDVVDLTGIECCVVEDNIGRQCKVPLKHVTARE